MLYRHYANITIIILTGAAGWGIDDKVDILIFDGINNVGSSFM